MELVTRWCIAALLISLPPDAPAAEDPANRPDDLQHMREELGVNEFTAPAIGRLFEELAALKPIPFETAWRTLPDHSPQDRRRLALLAGQVIANGFLAVSAEKQSRIEPVGRVLLKLARGLGVGDRINKRSKSILELAARQRWPEIQAELAKAQAEVEAGMIELKDEEIAHLVSLGGWLGGLEIMSSIVAENYSPARAKRLNQPELLTYYIDRVETLNPAFKASSLGKVLERDLGKLRALTARETTEVISLENVRQIRDLARSINKEINKTDE